MVTLFLYLLLKHSVVVLIMLCKVVLTSELLLWMTSVLKEWPLTIDMFVLFGCQYFPMKFEKICKIFSLKAFLSSRGPIIIMKIGISLTLFEIGRN